MTNSNGATRIDKRVAQFILVRSEIERIEEEQKAQLADLKKVRDMLIGEMLAFLDRTGQKSAKTAAGTVTVQVRDTAVCTDPDAFMDFVFENNLRELIERRANAVACKDHALANEGVLPPGVKINSKRTVGVTKA